MCKVLKSGTGISAALQEKFKFRTDTVPRRANSWCRLTFDAYSPKISRPRASHPKSIRGNIRKFQTWRHFEAIFGVVFADSDLGDCSPQMASSVCVDGQVSTSEVKMEATESTGSVSDKNEDEDEDNSETPLPSASDFEDDEGKRENF